MADLLDALLAIFDVELAGALLGLLGQLAGLVRELLEHGAQVGGLPEQPGDLVQRLDPSKGLVL